MSRYSSSEGRTRSLNMVLGEKVSEMKRERGAVTSSELEFEISTFHSSVFGEARRLKQHQKFV